MRRKIGQFEVQADNGQRFILLEYQEFNNVGTKEDPHAMDPGQKELYTSDGQHVNNNDDGTYEIVSLGLTVRRVS